MLEPPVIVRPACRRDMRGIWEVRYAVAENTLTPGRISDEELRRSLEEDGRGIGSSLHAQLLACFAQQPLQRLWLSTGADTRARRFYEARGWQYAGPYGNAHARIATHAAQLAAPPDARGARANVRHRQTRHASNRCDRACCQCALRMHHSCGARRLAHLDRE